MQAREALEQHDTSTNRAFMILVWAALFGITGLLAALGSRLGLDTGLFLRWAGGTGVVVGLIQLLMWTGWTPHLVKYLAVMSTAGALVALALVLPGSNQHLGLWFIPPAFAALYLNRRLVIVGLLVSLAGWITIGLINPPQVSGEMTVARLAIVNSGLILMVGGAGAVIANRFRFVYASLSGAVAQEEVLQRLDAIVARTWRGWPRTWRATTSAEEIAAAAEQVLSATRELGAGARSRSEASVQVKSATQSIS